MGSTSNLPLLRSPPFPWVDPATAAVSDGTAAADDPGGSGDAEALVTALRAARVGGAFWLPPAPRPAQGTTIVAGADRGRTAMLSTGVAHALAFDTAVDPWSVLHPGVSVLADGDHELAALASIAGVPVSVASEGRFGSPATGVDPARVARHLLAETRYRDPFSGGTVGVAEAVSLLALWRGWLDANRDVAVAIGIAGWKRRTIGRFLWAPRPTPLRFVGSVRSALRVARRTGGSVAAWPSRVSPALPSRAAAAGVAVSWIEDGFLRSVGLGSALRQPWSVVVDRQGIYYDPQAPSDLEQLLREAVIDPATLVRAAGLRTRIVAGRVSKYNGGADELVLPERVPGRRRLLVAGQVGDDQSVLRGGGGPFDAAALLARVRAIEPDAEIWFRPHPDVDAGFRRGAIPDGEALRHADRVMRGGSIAALLDAVDGVHVLTSLTGFEALLRGVDVTVHGCPFYAGWGLTRDLQPMPARRGRRRSLDELVAAALILYPRYLDPDTGLPCPAEVLVDRLAERRPAPATWLTRARDAQGRLLRKVGRART